MLMRYAVLALALTALGALSASAQQAPAAKLHYFKDIIDMPALIPPPPQPGTEEYKEDLQAVMDAQENRTDIQLQRALREKTLSIYLYDEVLGPKFNAKNLPVTDAFFNTMQGDARAVLMAAKNTIQRLRPIGVSKQVQALGGTPRLPTGYPSGGTTFTTSTAILLGQMIPEKRAELHERNVEYGRHRVLIGEHFPRDIRGGELTATVIVYALMQKPEFVRDFEAARAELRKTLGYPAEPELVGSVKPN